MTDNEESHGNPGRCMRYSRGQRFSEEAIETICIRRINSKLRHERSGGILSSLKFSVPRNPCSRICDLFKFGILREADVARTVTFALRRSAGDTRVIGRGESHSNANMCNDEKKGQSENFDADARASKNGFMNT